MNKIVITVILILAISNESLATSRNNLTLPIVITVLPSCEFNDQVSNGMSFPNNKIMNTSCNTEYVIYKNLNININNKEELKMYNYLGVINQVNTKIETFNTNNKVYSMRIILF